MMINLKDIQDAHGRIQSGIKHTAFRLLESLDERIIRDNELYLKFENRQVTNAFKERGGRNKLLLLDDKQKAKGVIAASAGNHAQAIARHAGLLGIPSTIIMPKGTPFNKVQSTKKYGANVILKGDIFDEAKVFAIEMSKEQGLVFCDPFDDEAVIAGQGTLALEMLADVPDLDVILVPVGGGGLISGMAIAAKEINPKIQIIGVQSEIFPYVYAKLNHQEIAHPKARTLAEGIAVKQPGMLTFEIIQNYVDDILLISERHIEDAINFLLEKEKVLAEGAGAAALAAYMAYSEKFSGQKIGIPITGGNIDMRMLATCLMRGLVRSQKIIALSILLDDVPGGLALTAQTISDKGGNVIEVQHQRQFGNAAGNQVTLDVTVETQDKAHAHEILEALHQKGFNVELKMADD
ncbi:MAG: threonine ammonia-lyase [Alphaproteobacteria bacterium]